MSKHKIVWYVPEEQGGIRTYSETLWPVVREACESAGWDASWVDSPPVTHPSDITEVVARLQSARPSLIHVHHEFGLFGSKIPPFYRFPEFVREVRREIPDVRLVATGHMVLDQESELPWRDRGWQTPARWLFNRLGMPWIRPSWMKGTWGPLDGVVVHSAFQEKIIRDSGCHAVRVIPLSVPHVDPVPVKSLEGNPVVLVFGYFSPEKGQDIVIRAWAKIKSNAQLVLAGGVRRAEDQAYFDKCRSLIADLGLTDRVKITGFVPESQVSEFYAQAAFTIAPFRFTSGSASLTQGFARGAPILTSDIPLNRELNDRVPGCLALFVSEDPDDCARQIDRLLSDGDARKSLSIASRAYAERYAPEKIAAEHVKFYESLLKK
jgi:glycosyltransferase involved in cell wall biosynthesis